jgi:tubulin polyglutamylase TTLL7
MVLVCHWALGLVLVSVVNSPEEISNTETMLVQEYLAKPFLIDGFKFDLRLYVLVTSVDPLRVFLYKDGLVRLSTTPYKAPTEANMSELYVHTVSQSLSTKCGSFRNSTDLVMLFLRLSSRHGT